MKLSLFEFTYAIVRLPSTASVPQWATGSSDFVSITRTRDELSVVAREDLVPANIAREGSRRLIQVVGPLDFSLTGVLSALLEPLARNKISIFAISTYDTDYLMVHKRDLQAALAALEASGHEFVKS